MGTQHARNHTLYLEEQIYLIIQISNFNGDTSLLPSVILGSKKPPQHPVLFVKVSEIDVEPSNVHTPHAIIKFNTRV